MAAREEILSRLRRMRRPRAGAAGQCAETTSRADDWADQAARFAAAARAAAATVDFVSAATAVPDAVAEYLAASGLERAVHLSAAPPGFPPATGHRLRCESGPLQPEGDTLVTGCFAALAEEGAIVMLSGRAHRPESCFIAATHVIIVQQQQLIASMDSLWTRLRDQGDVLPRMTNVILGPSRTADLGFPSRLGAHGPLRVHVILIGEPRAVSGGT